MDENETDLQLVALDILALALTAHNHVWSPRERDLYERAVSESLPEAKPHLSS